MEREPATNTWPLLVKYMAEQSILGSWIFYLDGVRLGRWAVGVRVLGGAANEEQGRIAKVVRTCEWFSRACSWQSGLLVD